MNHRCQRERCVRAASRDHDLCSLPQRLDDRLRAEIHVRARQFRGDLEKGRLSSIQWRDRNLRTPLGRERLEDLVSLHDAHPEPRDSLLLRSGEERLRTGSWVNVPCAGDHLDILTYDLRQEVADVVHEVASVSGLRVTLVLPVEDRHRHLGEVVEDEVIDRTGTHLKERRLGPVAPEGLSTGDPDHEITPSLS